MRVLEASILFAPVAYALLFALGGLLSLLPGSGATGESVTTQAFGLAFGVGLFAILGLGLLFLVLNPVAIYLDAQAVNEAGLEWEPNAPLYAIGSVFLGGLVPLHYLYKRYQHTADGTTHAWTWYLVAQFLVIAPGAAVLMAVVHPVMLTPLALSAGAFLVGIYRDAAYVRTRTDEWLPNPINWYLGAAFSVIFFGIGPLLVCAYYLFKRRKTVGLGKKRPTAGATAAD